MLEFSLYHKFLRISSVSLATVLLFQSGVMIPATALLSRQTEVYLASVVGVYASVSPTELNQITAGLTAKELALAEREKNVSAREIQIGISDHGSIFNQNKTTFILGSLLFVILVLIILNYALDYWRFRHTVVDQKNSLLISDS